MGTLGEKLSYLKETAEMINFPDYNVKLHSDLNPYSIDDTFRAKMEWVMYWMRMLFGQFGDNLMTKESEEIEVTLANGKQATLHNDINECIVVPPYTIDGYNMNIVGSSSNCLPFTIAHNQKQINMLGRYTIEHVDLSKIVVNDERRGVYVSIKSVSPIKSLILPPYFSFPYLCFGLMQLDNLFINGIKLGQTCHMDAGWVNGTIGTACNVPVDMPDGFYGNMRMEKLSFTADTIRHMFNALKDLTDTGESYTLGLGSTNLAKVTDDDIAIAEAKGWIIV